MKETSKTINISQICARNYFHVYYKDLNKVSLERVNTEVCTVTTQLVLARLLLLIIVIVTDKRSSTLLLMLHKILGFVVGN